MPYLYLAESFCELDHLTQLVNELEITNTKLTKLRDETFMYNEIYRVRKHAERDILIFGSHYNEYLRNNIIKVNGLIIRINQLLNDLPELSVMTDEERYQYFYGCRLKEELEGLAVFFINFSVYD